MGIFDGFSEIILFVAVGMLAGYKLAQYEHSEKHKDKDKDKDKDE